ncbi:hypothetical protein MtrunA17_Chr8g0338491 [Medicago truncatula]|uniref:Transmembrane protein n=1 Tax=Medicago truncatula TaxID=3880 RepID=A0A396GB94_MEDTR|nr:hypothetical protein MtrunA17_Chr8g0338491 [Medicago truncatula]
MQLDTMTLITLSLVRDPNITLSSLFMFKYILNLFLLQVSFGHYLFSLLRKP